MITKVLAFSEEDLQEATDIVRNKMAMTIDNILSLDEMVRKEATSFAPTFDPKIYDNFFFSISLSNIPAFNRDIKKRLQSSQWIEKIKQNEKVSKIYEQLMEADTYASSHGMLLLDLFRSQIDQLIMSPFCLIQVIGSINHEICRGLIIPEYHTVFFIAKLRRFKKHLALFFKGQFFFF